MVLFRFSLVAENSRRKNKPEQTLPRPFLPRAEVHRVIYLLFLRRKPPTTTISLILIPPASTTGFLNIGLKRLGSRLNPYGLALLFDESLILIMRTDPNPDEIRSILDCKRPVMRSGSHGPKLADLFKV
jgi:hypothetical protein